MRYEGPIYRPPSESESLIIQATVGCPHNKCNFCMVYKNGPRFKIRSLEEIKQDIRSAYQQYGSTINTIFLPAGNTICMNTDDLSRICEFCRALFHDLERITVYGSSQYIEMKGVDGLTRLANAGLTRIHVGLETGDDFTLSKINKGATQEQHIQAGRMTIESGLELSEYVLLGIAGIERSYEHALATAEALNQINPHFIRFRTLIPKINTSLLEDVQSGAFTLLNPHQVLEETEKIIEHLDVTSSVSSDHYSNYVNLEGVLPWAKEYFLKILKRSQQRDIGEYRPHFIGNE